MAIKLEEPLLPGGCGSLGAAQVDRGPKGLNSKQVRKPAQ